MPKKKTNFETDIVRLTEIVEQIDDGQTSLDTAINLYKEGMALVAKCGETLTQYEEEILVLQNGVLSHAGKVLDSESVVCP